MVGQTNNNNNNRQPYAYITHCTKSAYRISIFHASINRDAESLWWNERRGGERGGTASTR